MYQFIRNNGGWENYKMVLIETLECAGSLEACKRERQHIEDIRPTLNSNMPSRSVSEKYDSLTEERKEEIKTNRQQYVIDSDAKIKARKKRFKEAHKEQFVLKTNCVCGGTYQHQHKARHFKSTKHVTFMEGEFTDSDVASNNDHTSAISSDADTPIIATRVIRILKNNWELDIVYDKNI